MTLHKKIHNRLASDKIFYLYFLPVSFLMFVIAFLLMLYPGTAAAGVREGIDMCLETVIPSLFPFLAVSGAAYDTGIFDCISVKAAKATDVLFSLPAVAFPIIVMSVLGGFPVGATLIAKAFDSKKLSRPQAQRMLMFCVNPGPAFVVSAVGCSVLGSEKAGWIIYASVTLSSLTIGILSRFLAEKDEIYYCSGNRECLKAKPFLLSESINKSTESMVNICVWVVIFCCIGRLVEALPVKADGIIFFRMISEVTNGAVVASEHFSLPVVAAVISFAGLCVHFQVMPCLVKVGLRYKYFLSVRILSAALSCVFTFLLLKLFPQYSQVVSMGSKPQLAYLNVSPLVCACLMLMCGLFIIGDNYVLSRKITQNTCKPEDILRLNNIK